MDSCLFDDGLCADRYGGDAGRLGHRHGRVHGTARALTSKIRGPCHPLLSNCCFRRRRCLDSHALLPSCMAVQFLLAELCYLPYEAPESCYPFSLLLPIAPSIFAPLRLGLSLAHLDFLLGSLKQVCVSEGAAQAKSRHKVNKVGPATLLNTSWRLQLLAVQTSQRRDSFPRI